jgi:hypothetical protein
VYKWTSAIDKQLFIFDSDIADNALSENIIKERVYKDFTVEEAVNRIGLYILNHLKKAPEPFYVWVNDKSVLFSIKDGKWRGYNINPFRATDHNSEQLDEPISYEYHSQQLLNSYKSSSLNIVFASDLPKDLAKNKYFFSDLKYDTYKQYKKHDDKLLFLQKTDSTRVRIATEYFTKLTYQVQLNDIVLADVFDMLHTNKIIDMIQWIDDHTRVLYKLSKTHKIKKDWFVSWTNLEKVVKINVINLYSIVSKYGHCKIYIDNNNIMTIDYVFDARSFTKVTTIVQHKKAIIAMIQNALKQKLIVKDVAINSVIRFEVPNSSFKLLIKTIGEYIDIFHMIKSQVQKTKMSIICAYKRASNYNQNVDIYDYIRSRIELGLSKQEIVQELNNLGVVGNIDEMIMGEMDMVTKETQPNKDKVYQGTLVKIDTYSQGYNVSINDCPNHTELKYLIFWLSKIIATTITKDAPKVQKLKAVSPPKKLVASIPSSSSSSSSVDDKSVNYDSFDSFGSIGGATGCLTVRDMLLQTNQNDNAFMTPPNVQRVRFGGDVSGGGKNNNNYVIDMLQETDKELFANNYSRSCQKNFQPVVISKSYKEKLEQNNQFHFDNIVEYGSSHNNLNFYGCPRLWCPISKVPLSVDDVDAKCPAENEEPIQMFATGDKKKKRYVKLFKPNEKGMCIPCCGIKPPKQDEINKCKAYLNKDLDANGADADAGRSNAVSSVNEKVKHSPVNKNAEDEYYIMNQSAPIPSGRFGNIPEYLHNILYDGKIAAESCSKTVQKTHSCFVRKGIKNARYDSIVLVISDILGFKNKKEFVRDLRKRLDFITFLSLDNGNILKKFMSMREIIPKNNKKLVKAFKQFQKTHGNLCNIYSIELSRILNIYFAYVRYIEYISSNDFHLDKDPVHFYSLVMTLYDITLLVWEKDTDAVLLNCPQQTYVKIDFNPSVAMIIKDGHFFEQVVLKTRGSMSVNVFKINEYPKLKEVISNCIYDNKSVDVYKKLYTLNNWAKSKVLQNSSKYIFKKVLINNDLSINKIMTNGNILLEFDPIDISLLPVIISDYGISESDVLFYDDVVDTVFNISARKNDLGLFSEKCQELSVSLNIGTVKNDTDKNTDYYSVLTLKKYDLPSGLMIHISKDITYPNKSNKLYELKKMVVKRIVKNYDNTDKLENLDKLDRLPKVKELMKLFTDVPHKKNIQIILEEIPTRSIEGLKKWLSNFVIQHKYGFLTNVIDEKRTEFVFSQNAFIVNGIKIIPVKLIKYHKALPLELLDAHIQKQDKNSNYNQDADITNVEIAWGPEKGPEKGPDVNILPSLFEGKYEKLGTKWVMHKKSNWINMVYIKSTYGKNSLSEFVDWFAAKLGLMISYNEVLLAARQMHYDVLDNKDIMLQILQDQSYFNQWQQAVRRKFSTVQLFWDNMYSRLTNSQRQKYLSVVLEEIYPNDLFVLCISKLLNISILLIHRGKYGKFDTNETARGGISDLIISSTLYPAETNLGNRPLIILNKVNEKRFTAYYLVVDNVLKQIYMKYNELPNNVKMLTDSQLQNF